MKPWQYQHYKCVLVLPFLHDRLRARPRRLAGSPLAGGDPAFGGRSVLVQLLSNEA